MPEFEELVLRVRLDSNEATQQLARLKRDITEIGGGPSNLPKLRRELQDLRGQVKPFAEETSAASAAMLAFAGRAMLMVGAVGALGYGAYAAGQKLAEFSNKMVALGNLARETGWFDLAPEGWRKDFEARA
ncbi:MAG: hypothetical protein AUI16_21335 [Alphaproteobacteria bacterium 13_2_20CM_2_64_7]|jgi:phage-related minor tail protein|nr:MAG: hypothetical protein AUI16_21335 [Alphaproteobacteria bacterium 13_2_20CM_2_64_7]